MSMPNKEKALLLDWGIGGLSVFRELSRLRPELEVVYFSDSGFTPYGKVSSGELSRRVAQVISWGRSAHHVNRAVIACNAASTVLEQVRRICPGFQVNGVIEAGIELVKESGCRRVGVIGGQRTIDSRIFSSALQGSAVEVLEQVAQPLSALIERGVLEGKELEAALEPILHPLRHVEALVLACTHYPAIAPSIQQFLPKAKLLDPSKRAAQHLHTELPPFVMRSAQNLFFTSGSISDSESAALAAFGVSARFELWVSRS